MPAVLNFGILHFYLSPSASKCITALPLALTVELMEQADAPAVVLHEHTLAHGHANSYTPVLTARLSGSVRESAQRGE